MSSTSGADYNAMLQGQHRQSLWWFQGLAPVLSLLLESDPGAYREGFSVEAMLKPILILINSNAVCPTVPGVRVRVRVRVKVRVRVRDRVRVRVSVRCLLLKPQTRLLTWSNVHTLTLSLTLNLTGSRFTPRWTTTRGLTCFIFTKSRSSKTPATTLGVWA